MEPQIRLLDRFRAWSRAGDVTGVFWACWGSAVPSLGSIAKKLTKIEGGGRDKVGQRDDESLGKCR